MMPEIDLSDPRFQSLAGMVVLGGVLLSKFWPQIKGWFGGVKGKALTLRGADQDAPAGTAQYLKDLQAAAPGSDAKYILARAMDGDTIAGCQRKWIEILVSERDGKTFNPEVKTANTAESAE